MIKKLLWDYVPNCDANKVIYISTKTNTPNLNKITIFLNSLIILTSENNFNNNLKYIFIRKNPVPITFK